MMAVKALIFLEICSILNRLKRKKRYKWQLAASAAILFLLIAVLSANLLGAPGSFPGWVDDHYKDYIYLYIFALIPEFP